MDTARDEDVVDAAAIASLCEQPTVVLGVVVEVPQPWGEELQEWRTGFGDNTADHMPTHITVWPPTKVASGRLESVLQGIGAACAAVPQFNIHTAGVETFRPVSPVVYLSIDTGSAQLAELHQTVQPIVSDSPAAHPYVPHITVAFHLPDAVLDAAAAALSDYEVSWQARALSSFLRRPDGRWVRAAQHPLSPA